MLYRRFERLIDPFRSASERMPPSEVLRFYVYFLRQVWPVFLALLVVGLIVALIEVALFSYLGRIVDLAQSTPSAEFFRVHANELIWMAVVALVLRPLFNALHDMLVHQSINPSMTNLIRWQNHRYVLKQSLGFFQNDFAGRIAQRIMQTGNSLRDSAVQVVDALWHVLIYTVSALVLFAEADWRLMIPLVLWVFAYVGAPRLLRSPGQAPLGGGLGFALEADGADRRRLHQHHHAEAVRPHPPGRGLRPRSDRRPDPQVATRRARSDLHGRDHHGDERRADHRHHRPGPVAVEPGADLGGRHRPWPPGW